MRRATRASIPTSMRVTMPMSITLPIMVLGEKPNTSLEKSDGVPTLARVLALVAILGLGATPVLGLYLFRGLSIG